MTTVTVKLTHKGLDYGLVELHATTPTGGKTLEDVEVPLEVAEWLEQIGAYNDN